MTNYDILKEYEAHQTPVPSYKEWKEKNETAYLLAQGITIRNKDMEKLEEENAQLKELLKECSPYISHSATSRMIKNSAGHKKDMKLLIKIDEALK